jgi:4-amino-4-deoxy-L-arabinose transferase-like glycosyltransferase
MSFKGFQSLRKYLRMHKVATGWLLIAVMALGGLLLYRLGALTGGLSKHELSAAAAPVGWHGMYRQPLDLPLTVVRSVVFYLFPAHGQLLSRLPNALFGGLTIISFATVIRLWHGTRIALLATALFAASAWVLHVSRLASFDVVYLWTIPTLLLSNLALKHYNQRASGRNWVWYASLLAWGLLIYIPGVVWLVIANGCLQPKLVADSWRQQQHWQQRLLSVAAVVIWLPLLIVDLTRPGQLLAWLGLPEHLAGPAKLLKQLVAVAVHLFIRGPQYPELWLGRAPLLDVFTLAVSLTGLYFYVRHWQAVRSRLLACFLGVGIVLVASGGPVGLSLLVPILYITAATGIAYLLHEWLQVFPLNPVARGLGIGLVAVAVSLSCLYNLRAYFIAWPHNTVTQSTFQYHRQP